MAEVERIDIVKLTITKDQYETIVDAMANCNCRSLAVENKQLALLQELDGE